MEHVVALGLEHLFPEQPSQSVSQFYSIFDPTDSELPKPIAVAPGKPPANPNGLPPASPKLVILLLAPRQLRADSFEWAPAAPSVDGTPAGP